MIYDQTKLLTNPTPSNLNEKPWQIRLTLKRYGSTTMIIFFSLCWSTLDVRIWRLQNLTSTDVRFCDPCAVSVIPDNPSRFNSKYILFYTMEKCFFQFEVFINVLVSFFHSFKYLCFLSTAIINFDFFSVWGSTLDVKIWRQNLTSESDDYKRQITTSKCDPCAVSVIAHLSEKSGKVTHSQKKSWFFLDLSQRLNASDRVRNDKKDSFCPYLP